MPDADDFFSVFWLSLHRFLNFFSRASLRVRYSRLT